MVDNINKNGFEISSIARFAGMSNSTLHDVFEKIIGQWPTHYLQKNTGSPGANQDRQQRPERW